LSSDRANDIHASRPPLLGLLALLLSMLLCLLSAPGRTEAPLDLSAREPAIIPQLWMQQREDASVEQMLESWQRGRAGWQHYDSSDLPFLSHERLWLALPVSSTSAEINDYWLTLPHSSSNSFDFYYFRAGKLEQSYSIDRHTARSDWPINHLFPAFPFRLAPGEQGLILLKVSGLAKFVGERMNIRHDRDLAYSPHGDSLWQVACLAILLALGLYNLVLYVFLRDRVYLYYVLYIWASAFFFFSFRGLGFQYAWPDNPQLNEQLTLSGLYVFYISAAHFCCLFLQLKKIHPWIYWLLQGLAAIWAVAAVAVFIPPASLSDPAIKLLMFSTLLFKLSILCIALLDYRRGNKNARNFLIAWSPMLVALLYASLYHLGFFKPTFLALYASQAAQLFEAIMLSLALAYRINELQSRELIALQESRSKSDFIATMSHEIRTPMTGILGMSELLSGRLENSTNKEYNDIIHSSGKALLCIVNDILDYSKIEAGKIQLEAEPFDLEKTCADALTSFRFVAETKRLNLGLYYDPALPRQLLGDSGRLRQILMNLLGNAIKFTQRGSITLWVEADAETLRLSVRDTGIGLSPEQRERLFVPYQQADQKVHNQYGGTGLGLVICQRLAELMGGDIRVESEAGQGSQFYLTLPRPEPSAPEREASVAKRQASAPKGERPAGLSAACLSIGEAPVAEMAKRYCQQLGYQLSHASDLDQLNQAERPDLTIIAIAAETELAGQRAALEDYAKDSATLLLLPGFETAPSQASSAQLSVIFSFNDFQQACRHALAPDAHPAAATAQADSQAAPTQALHILLADDNQVNRLVIGKMLEKLQHQAAFAEDGQQALEIYQRSLTTGAFDLILMDCEMPRLNGFEACRAIRALELKNSLEPVRMLALTAHAMREQRQLCHQAGMDGMVTKPITLEQLARCCAGEEAVH